MKVLENTLAVEVDRWDDPGDYPNSIASSPLPSYDYVTGLEGYVKVKLDVDELDLKDSELIDVLKETGDLDIPSGIEVTEWSLTRHGEEVVFVAEDID